jgi:energy-converting hydrogenase Eha subunit B
MIRCWTIWQTLTAASRRAASATAAAPVYRAARRRIVRRAHHAGALVPAVVCVTVGAGAAGAAAAAWWWRYEQQLADPGYGYAVPSYGDLGSGGSSSVPIDIPVVPVVQIDEPSSAAGLLIAIAAFLVVRACRKC